MLKLGYQTTTDDYGIAIERRREENKGRERERRLTKRRHGNYRGKDTYKRIPIVDVIHPIDLLASVVSDYELLCEIQVEEVRLLCPRRWLGVGVS